MERLIGLQVLRFVAAALVVWAHAVDTAIRIGSRPSLPYHLENFGAVGVDVFFVLSGFIITAAALWAPPADAFLRRRITRVVPIYYLLSLPMVLLQLVDGRIDFRALLVTLTFWPALPGRIKLPILDVGWTLSFEMLFYCAVAAVLARRAWLWPILAALALFMVANLFVEVSVAQFLGNAIIIEFLFGVLIALGVARLGQPGVKTGALSLTAGVAALAVTAILGFGEVSEVDAVLTSHIAWLRVLIWGLPSALVVFGFLGLETTIRPAPLSGPLAFLGDASYALYLCHVPVMILLPLAITLSGLPAGAAIGTLLLASIATSIGIHLLVERPLLRLFRRAKLPAFLRSGGKPVTRI